MLWGASLGALELRSEGGATRLRATFPYGAETELMPGVGHGLPLDPHWKSLAWRLNAWLDERRIGVARRQHSAVR